MILRDNSTGLLIVGHGTRSLVGTRQLLVLAGSLAPRLSPMPIQPAFLELQQPDIAAAVERLAHVGVSRIVTMPLLLFAAGHAKRDIPQEVQAALAGCGLDHVEVVQTAPLGCHPALIELSSRRMHEALSDGAKPSSDDMDQNAACLLLVGRGSHDPLATAEMHEFAGRRAQLDQQMHVEVAFLAMAQPLLREQLCHVVRQDYRRVIVQPHLLFHGELVESIERQVREVAAQNPSTQWVLTEPLADRPEFITAATELFQKVILDRCHEAGIRVVALTAGD